MQTRYARTGRRRPAESTTGRLNKYHTLNAELVNGAKRTAEQLLIPFTNPDEIIVTFRLHLDDLAASSTLDADNSAIGNHEIRIPSAGSTGEAGVLCLLTIEPRNGCLRTLLDLVRELGPDMQWRALEERLYRRDG